MSFIFPDKNSNLNYEEFALYCINATISENKKITELYTSTYNDLVANGTISYLIILLLKNFHHLLGFVKRKI
jgi:hypothetical protein